MILSKFQVYSKVIQLYMCVHACMLSHFSRVALEPYGLYVARQAPLSLKFSRQEYWSRSLSLGDLPDSGIKLHSPALQADSILSEPPGKPSFYDKGSLLKRMGWMRARVWLHAHPHPLLEERERWRPTS